MGPAIPVFRTESSIPRAVAGLKLEGVDIYPDRNLGFKARYGSGMLLKADTYLYDLGRRDIPADIRSEEVVGCFQEACGNILGLGEQGRYLDLEVRASQFLHLPDDAPEPFCLWAAFAYRQAPGPGSLYDGGRFSHLALRTDRGYFNKMRFTYPDEESVLKTAPRQFIEFLCEWTEVVQKFGDMAPN
jgi:hypothetical protein